MSAQETDDIICVCEACLQESDRYIRSQSWSDASSAETRPALISDSSEEDNDESSSDSPSNAPSHGLAFTENSFSFEDETFSSNVDESVFVGSARSQGSGTSRSEGSSEYDSPYEPADYEEDDEYDSLDEYDNVDEDPYFEDETTDVEIIMEPILRAFMTQQNMDSSQRDAWHVFVQGALESDSFGPNGMDASDVDESGGVDPALLEESCPLVSAGSLNYSEECIICKEECEGESLVRKMPCSHVFHGECVDLWLSRQASCPTCRHSLEDMCGAAEEDEDEYDSDNMVGLPELVSDSSSDERDEDDDKA